MTLLIAAAAAIMNISEMNSRFGAPGRIVFREGFAGHPNVVLANKYGNAEVALYGASVLSYRPTGHGDVLFRPAKKDAEYKDDDNFHGGVPVCWPQFGNRMSKDLPQHGFARHRLFEVLSTEYTEEKTEIALVLRSDAETSKIWNHGFELVVKICVSMKLNLSIVTKNTGSDEFMFSGGFHPYFRVMDRNRVTVRGLDGCQVYDGTQSTLPKSVHHGDIAMTRGYDHIFELPTAPKHEAALIDSALHRAIAVVSTGNDRMIVWNPDTEYVVDDHSSDDWKKFVCVEPVSDWPGGRVLKPGESHILAAAIQASLEER